jgi:hypothetical protein
MRFNATFRSTFPVDAEAHPQGKELADFLAERLSRQGIRVFRVVNHDDFAWMIETGTKGGGPFALIGYVGDDDFEWLLQIHSGVGILRRLLGVSDVDLREALARGIHRILAEDQRFSSVRWHEGQFSEFGWSPLPDPQDGNTTA